MALDATALVDVATAKSFCLVVGDADNLLLEAAINSATLVCERYCNRVFKERAVTAERVEGPSSTRLWLSATPLKVAAAVTVSVDDVAQTVWKQESDGLQSGFDVIARPDHLYRRNGWSPWNLSRGGWAGGPDPYNVLLAYTGGYATAAIPADLREACLLIVQKSFRDSKRQLAEVAQVNTPMGGVTILDNAMPRRARDLLGPFKYAAVA